MILFIYNIALVALLLVGAPAWLLRARWRDGLRERMGAGAARVAATLAGRKPVWVHAVSVGEVVAISRLVEELDARLGEGSVVISTTTRTGQQLARQRFGANRCFYFPIDLPWVVGNAMRRLRPRLLVLAESELWPNVLAECERQNVPVVVVNARVSDRSLPRYRRFGMLWRPLLKKLTLVLAQSAEDARRFAAIGVPEGRVRVGGNLKYDARPPQSVALIAQWQQQLAQGSKVLIAGSTLEDEERVVLSGWPAILARVPDVVLVLAPRHPERFDRVAALARELGVGFVRRSEWKGDAVPAGSALLLDSIGELSSMYGLASVAFVGGSLVAAGGHNPLEPARFAVPVVMGPHYANFREVVELLREAGGLQVADRAGLHHAIASLLEDAASATAMGKQGQRVFEAQAGATDRAVEAIYQLLVAGGR